MHGFLKAQLHRDLEKEDVAEVLEYALLLDGDKFPFGWVELAQINGKVASMQKGLPPCPGCEGIAVDRRSARKASVG